MSQKILSLKCASCNEKLEGENHAAVFFCYPCSLAFNIGQHKLSLFPLHFCKPGSIKSFDQVYFPFWKLESVYSLYDKDNSKESTGNRTFFVPAFFIKSIDHFGDIGLYYTLKKIDPVPGNRQKIDVFPAAKDLKQAAAYPQLYLETEHVKQGGGLSPEIKLKHRKAEILLIPFYRDKNHYSDSLLDWRYPCGALV